MVHKFRLYSILSDMMKSCTLLLNKPRNGYSSLDQCNHLVYAPGLPVT